eukprot:10654085-Karenia_brevis.AAC.1
MGRRKGQGSGSNPASPSKEKEDVETQAGKKFKPEEPDSGMTPAFPLDVQPAESTAASSSDMQRALTSLGDDPNLPATSGMIQHMMTTMMTAMQQMQISIATEVQNKINSEIGDVKTSLKSTNNEVKRLASLTSASQEAFRAVQGELQDLRKSTEASVTKEQ